jgi:hypothetical protein
MNAKLVALATLLVGSGLTWGQDIVLKASFPRVDTSSFIGMRTFEPVDVNDDEIPEIPGQEMDQSLYYLDITNMHKYYLPDHAGLSYPQSAPDPMTLTSRRVGIAEFVVSYVNSFGLGLRVIDIASGDVLLNCPECISKAITDYDRDGLDDIITVAGNEVRIYGIATGNPPISPPQGLDIQTVGNDYIITWNVVPSATAYRVEWSSSIDGVRFTRIGYTTGTTFTHRNQADQERGFYRVLSEDNGTGVVRIVGQGR